MYYLYLSSYCYVSTFMGYQLFESVVSTLQTQMQNTKEDQKEEIARLLMQ